MLNSKIILKIFSDFLDNTVSVPDSESEDRALNLFRLSIEINQKQWRLEDLARKTELGSEHVAKTKQEIDKSNQIRNDLIREIDIEVANQLKVVPLDSVEQFYGEGPGMIIDRLAILYIKLSVIRKLLAVIQEKDSQRQNKSAGLGLFAPSAGQCCLGDDETKNRISLALLKSEKMLDFFS